MRRMHRDLSELERNPAVSRRAQQRICDRWMVDFNEVRPHDGLGEKTPAEVYRNSERRSLALCVPSYPADWEPRRVSSGGTVSISNDIVFLSSTLRGQLVGLKREGLLRWRARFFDIDFGTIEVAPIDSALAPLRPSDSPVSTSLLTPVDPTVSSTISSQLISLGGMDLSPPRIEL